MVRFIIFTFETAELLSTWVQSINAYVINGAAVQDYYEVLDKLGGGPFGYELLLAATKVNPKIPSLGLISCENPRVALKIIDKTKIIMSVAGLQSLMNEIRAHWTLSHCEGVS